MDKDPFSQKILETDPCQYLVKYSSDVLMKQTKCLNIFNVDKKRFYINKNRIKKIRIRIRFLKIIGSPSLVCTYANLSPNIQEQHAQKLALSQN